MRKFPEVLDDFEQKVLTHRLEGWELVEFLQIPVEKVLAAALENDWIDDDNVLDLKEFVGLKE